MDTISRRSLRPLAAALATALLLALLSASGPALAATDGPEGTTAVLAAETERERRPIAPTQRDQLGLILYGLMGLAVVAGGATLRRQLRGDRPQTDGEFRWR